MRRGAYAYDFAGDLEAVLLEALAREDGLVRRKRNDRAGRLYAQSCGEGREGIVSCAQVDVYEVRARVLHLSEQRYYSGLVEGVMPS